MTPPPFIDVDELVTALAGTRPPRVLDARWYLNGSDGRADFESRHVPGAQWVDLNTELAAPPGDGGRHPLPDPAVFRAAMQRVGLQPGEWVVAMDDGSLLGAARLWWLLMDAGVETRVLDGGLAAWVDAGQPVSRDTAAEPASSTIELTGGRLPRADAEDVLARLGVERPGLWDVRAPERFHGRTEPVDPVAGHPGAENLPASRSFADGRVRDASELRDLFADVRPDDIVYCGSGVTAAQTLLVLQSLGITDVRLYPGSWSDWITDPRRPVATD